MLPFHKKFAYGMGRFGSTFLSSLASFTLFLIYGTAFELNWLLNGIAQAVSFLSASATALAIGYVSDKTETRLGRRKPFVILGVFGLAFSGVLIYVPNWFVNLSDPAQEIALFGYYLLFLCMFKSFYTFTLVPFQSWLPEITNAEERPLVSSLQNTANWVGNGFAVVLAFLMPLMFITGLPARLSSLGFIIVLAFSIIMILFYIPSIVLVREKSDVVVPKRLFKQELATIVTNHVYKRWLLIAGFLSITIHAIISQIVGYTQHILLLNSFETLIPAALILLFSITISLFIWSRVLRQMSKGRLLLMSLIVLALLLILTPFIGDLAYIMPRILVTVIYYTPLGAFMAVWFIVNYVILADIIHKDEIDSGESRAGIYMGFNSIAYGIFQSFSAFALGWLMDYSVLATGSDVFGFLWWGPFFAPFLLVAAFLLRNTNVDLDLSSTG